MNRITRIRQTLKAILLPGITAGCVLTLSACTTQSPAHKHPVTFPSAAAAAFTYDDVNHVLHVLEPETSGLQSYYALLDTDVRALAKADDVWAFYHTRIVPHYPRLPQPQALHNQVLIPVASLDFKAAGYDAAHRIFYLQFRDGRLRQFYDFPRELYDRFMSVLVKHPVYVAHIEDRYVSSVVAQWPLAPHGLVPHKIMPLGDSITQGGRTHSSYRRSLWKNLYAAGYYVDFVGSRGRNGRGEVNASDFDPDHEGHSAWTAGRVLGYLDEWAGAATPESVLIHLGTGDVYSGRELPEAIVDLEQILIILRRHNPRVSIFLATLIPSAKPGLSRVPAMNTLLKDLAIRADQETSRVYLVDQYEGFSVANDLYDGIHPGDSGEEKMAVKWLSALVPTLPASTRMPVKP
ncbi:MAG: acyl-CoA thioesterase-1 [Kiritimatiellia bacterium]|jgi:acyl-CoA thioesterase-1